jgi:hypothetical protein
LRGQGIVIRDDVLSQVALLPSAHIALTGDYLWNEIDRPIERFRPIRANRFNPRNLEWQFLPVFSPRTGQSADGPKSVIPSRPSRCPLPENLRAESFCNNRIVGSNPFHVHH